MTFDQQLRVYAPHLSTKEKTIADYLTAHRDRAQRQSISELSTTLNLSTATLSRFAKNLGYNNFQTLRVALGQPASQKAPMFAEIDDQDDVATIAKKVFTANRDALSLTEAALDPAVLSQAVDLIVSANTLGLFGLGASNLVAQNGYHKFLKTPKALSYSSDYHMQLMAATHLTDQDCAILISHTGVDQDALALAHTLHEQQVPLIVITSNAKSKLAKLATVTLSAYAEETQYREEALHALIAHFTLIDTLFMLTAIAMDPASTAVATRIAERIKETRA